MSKQYGLIDAKANKASKTGITKHAAFESGSDSDSPDPKKSVNLELGESQKRQVKAAQAKVLAEDPTIYQYDELYDDMDNKRKESKTEKSKEERKPKYIGKLLETAEKRKKEQERRIERQVQKDREAEGEMFKDKESFVTSAYRAKLEEMKKAEEDEKREEYLENIGDVTKQSDLGGFYRHIYSQKMGEDSDQKKIVNEKAEGDKEHPSASASDEEPKQEDRKRKDDSESDEEERARLEALKSKEAVQAKERRYRKRRSDDEDNDENEKNDSSKKVHLQSNLDADSDFSIDSNSSSSSSESEHGSDSDHDNDKERKKDGKKSIEELPEEQIKTEDPNASTKEEKSSKVNGNEISKVEEDSRSMKETKKKEPKIDIWKKRTVGGVFDAALQKYYERKAARESG